MPGSSGLACLADPLAVGGEGFQDLVGRLGPDERPGVLFHSLIHRRMSASSSVTLRCAERRSLRVVSSANHLSTRLSHEELVGVKCRRKRGCFSSHWWMTGVLWVA